MNRRRFLAAGCSACLGGSAFLTLLAGCSSGTITASIEGSDLIVPLNTFQAGGNGFRKVIVAQHSSLLYPVCIYRFSPTEYVALFMQCTHQGTELLLQGDRLACPGHGSEFDNRGAVIQGPASDNLRTFPVTINNDQLRISLRR